MSLPGGAMGDPIRSLVRAAWQTAEGVPAVSGYVDGYHNGAALSTQRGYLAPQALLGGTVRPAQLSGRFEHQTSLDLGDLDPGSLLQLRMLAAVMDAYATTIPAAGRYRHVLGASQSTAVPGPLTVLTDPDSGIRPRWADVRPSGFTIGASPSQNLNLAVPLVAGKVDFWDDGTQTAGSGSDLPILRHFGPDNFETDATDRNVHLKVATVSGGVSVTVQAKVATAGTYGDSFVVPLGVWTDIVVGAGATADILGEWAQTIQVYLAADGTYVALDEFEFEKRRERWVPSFSVRRALVETQARFYLAGSELPLEGGWTLTAAFPGATVQGATGCAQPTGTQRVGFRDVSLQINRQMRDRLLEDPAMKGTGVACVIQARTDVKIASTAVSFGMAFVLPALTVTKSSFAVQSGGQNRDEQATLTAGAPASAYSWGGLSLSDELTIVVDTDVVSLA